MATGTRRRSEPNGRGYGRFDRHDPAKAIEIRPTDAVGWPIMQAYTPWSIAAELFDADRRSIASFDDCGMSVVVSLTAEEAVELGAKLPAGHEIELLLEFQEQKKATEQRRRSRFVRLRSKKPTQQH